MNRTARYPRRAGLVFGAVALITGCADVALVGPESRTLDGTMAASFATDLGECDNLQAPAGSKLVSRMYARGVQIYRWDGASWVFVAPSAKLSADPNGRSRLGTHYAGPTWESNSGSQVIAAVIDRCTPDAGAIPWLSLGATSSTGPGIFHRVVFIQRLNTTGGNAPASPGSFIGAMAEVPYTAEYLFYRL